MLNRDECVDDGLDNPPGQRLLVRQDGGLADPVRLWLRHLGSLVVDAERLLDLKLTERHYPGYRAAVEGALVRPDLLLDRMLRPTAFSSIPNTVVGASLFGPSLAPGIDVTSRISDTLVPLPGSLVGLAGDR